MRQMPTILIVAMKSRSTEKTPPREKPLWLITKTDKCIIPSTKMSKSRPPLNRIKMLTKWMEPSITILSTIPIIKVISQEGPILLLSRTAQPGIKLTTTNPLRTRLRLWTTRPTFKTETTLLSSQWLKVLLFEDLTPTFSHRVMNTPLSGPPMNRAERWRLGDTSLASSRMDMPLRLMLLSPSPI
jgi:hypothetical protein